MNSKNYTQNSTGNYGVSLQFFNNLSGLIVAQSATLFPHVFITSNSSEEITPTLPFMTVNQSLTLK